MSAKRVFHLLGLIGKNKGHRKEDKVVEVFNCVNLPNPSWLGHISKAPSEMDKKGVDIIVETTDVGDIFLQIKSSEKGKNKFIKAHPDSNIGVVIVRDEDSDDTIRHKIISETARLRAGYLQKKIN